MVLYGGVWDRGLITLWFLPITYIVRLIFSHVWTLHTCRTYLLCEVAPNPIFFSPPPFFSFSFHCLHKLYAEPENMHLLASHFFPLLLPRALHSTAASLSVWGRHHDVIAFLWLFFPFFPLFNVDAISRGYMDFASNGTTHDCTYRSKESSRGQRSCYILNFFNA